MKRNISTAALIGIFAMISAIVPYNGTATIVYGVDNSTLIVDQMSLTVNGETPQEFHSPKPAEIIYMEAQPQKAVEINIRIRNTESTTLSIGTDLLQPLLYQGRDLIRMVDSPISVQLEEGLTTLRLLGTLPEDPNAIIAYIVDSNVKPVLDIRSGKPSQGSDLLVPPGAGRNSPIQQPSTIESEWSGKIELLQTEIMTSTLPDPRKEIYLDKMQFLGNVNPISDAVTKELDEVEANFIQESERSSKAWSGISSAQSLLDIQTDPAIKEKAEVVMKRAMSEYERGEYETSGRLADQVISILTDPRVLEKALPWIVIGVAAVVGVILYKKLRTQDKDDEFQEMLKLIDRSRSWNDNASVRKHVKIEGEK